MINKSKLYRILYVTVLSLAGLSFLALLGFVSSSQNELAVKSVVVDIQDRDEHDFVDKAEVLSRINAKGKIIGKPVGSLNFTLLEKRILSNPWVKTAEVYSAIDGTLYAELEQRHPVVRIINVYDEQFYIDSEGVFMPVSDRHTPPVLVANGQIFNRFSEGKIGYRFTLGDSAGTPLPRMVGQIFTTARAIEADTFWSENTEQLYVNEFQEMEMIPRVGNHRILIGDTSNLADKLDRLRVFYLKGLDKTGWDKYELINLKYKGQVVCTKRN
jgi:cell division protein FtsQ